MCKKGICVLRIISLERGKVKDARHARNTQIKKERTTRVVSVVVVHKTFAAWLTWDALFFLSIFPSYMYYGRDSFFFFFGAWSFLFKKSRATERHSTQSTSTHKPLSLLLLLWWRWWCWITHTTQKHHCVLLSPPSPPPTRDDGS